MFVEGGVWIMTILTILLVAIFFAAWKAPRWVKEIGAIALAIGVLGLLFGLRQMFDALQKVSMMREDVSGLFDIISPGVLFGGLKVSTISLIYSIFIYIVSLIIGIIQKPKLYLDDLLGDTFGEGHDREDRR